MSRYFCHFYSFQDQERFFAPCDSPRVPWQLKVAGKLLVLSWKSFSVTLVPSQLRRNWLTAQASQLEKPGLS